MTSKKTTTKSSVSKYCGIQSYLNANYPKLIELFKQLCIGKDLQTHPKYNGLTFIVPTAKTITAWDKDSTVRPAEVINLMRMHVIADFIPDAKTFFAKKDDIPNRLGDKVPVVSGAKGVSIYDGIEIEPATDMEFFTINQKYTVNQAVWKIKSSEIKPQTSPVKATYVHALRVKKEEKKSAATTKGGYEDFKVFDVKKFVGQLIGTYINTRTWKLRVGDDTPLFRNECVENTISLMLWLRQNNPTLFTKLSNDYTPDPVVNMLTLFGMVPDNVLSEWYGSRIPIDTMLTKHIEMSAKFSTEIEYNSPVSITTLREVLTLYQTKFGKDAGFLRFTRDMGLFYSMTEVLPCEAKLLKSQGDKVLGKEFRSMIETLDQFLKGRVAINIVATKENIDQESLMEFPQWKAFIADFVKTMLTKKGVEGYKAKVLEHLSNTALNTPVNYKKMLDFAAAIGGAVVAGGEEQSFRERLAAKANEAKASLNNTLTDARRRAEDAAINSAAGVMNAATSTAAKAANLAVSTGEKSLSGLTGTVSSVITL